VVIQQGDAAMSGVFFVKSGSLRVIQEIKDANGTSRFLEVNQLGPYSFFGEYAFVHRCTRSASVIANSACELVELGRFDWLRRVDPDTLSAAAELTLQYPDERTVIKFISLLFC
jgi:CRP-like cAMP-binding protein